MRIYDTTADGHPYSLNVAPEIKPATLDALRRMMELLAAHLAEKEKMLTVEGDTLKPETPCAS